MFVRDTFIPRFKDQDMPGGIMAGAGAINEQLKLPLEAAEARATEPVDAGQNRGKQGGGSWFMPVFWVFILFLVILPGIGACINTPWQLIREWLVLLLTHRGYTEKLAQLFNSAYYVATDVGCLIAGVATLWLVKRGSYRAPVARARLRRERNAHCAHHGGGFPA